MIAILCDMCHKPLDSNSDFCEQQGYRFKGSFVYIRAGRFLNKAKEVEEGVETFDICMKCYDRLKKICEEATDD